MLWGVVERARGVRAGAWMSRNGGFLFGEIRSVLQQPPSASRWEELCHYVSEWSGPEDFAEVVLPYILSHLELGWPEWLRRSPLRWREGLARGASLPFMPMVRVLDASRLGLRNEDLLTLARAPMMRSSASALDLSHNPFGWRGLMHVFESAPRLEEVRALSLDHTGVGAEGVRLIAETPALHGLEVLSLAQLDVSPESLRTLAMSQHLSALHTVNLSGNNLSERHIEALTDGACFARWHTLLLHDNPLRSRGAIRLFYRAPLSQLRALDISRCEFAAPVAEMIGQCKDLQGLEVLRMADDPLTRHAEGLGRGGQLTRVHTIDVRGVRGLGLQSLERLLESGALPELRHIALGRASDTLPASLLGVASERGITLATSAPISLGLLGDV